jgi:hypothetical protein
MSEQVDPIDFWTILKLVAVVAVICAILSLIPAGLVEPESTGAAAGDAGYTNIQMKAYRLDGCGFAHSFWTGYIYRTGFKALDKTGKPVSGVVCAGIGKSPFMKMDPPGIIK